MKSMKKFREKNFTVIFLSFILFWTLACSHQQKTLSHSKLRERIDEFQTLVAKLPYPPTTTGIIYGDAHLENFLWLKSFDDIYPNDFDSVKTASLLSDFYRLALAVDIVYNRNKESTLSLEQLKSAYLLGLTNTHHLPPQNLSENEQHEYSGAKFLQKKEYARDLTAEEKQIFTKNLKLTYPQYQLSAHYLRVKTSGGSKGKKRFQLWLENSQSKKNLWVEYKEQDPKEQKIVDKMNMYFQKQYFDSQISFVQLENILYIRRAREQFKKHEVIDLELEILEKNPHLIALEFTSLGSFQKMMNEPQIINNVIAELKNLNSNQIRENLNFLKENL